MMRCRYVAFLTILAAALGFAGCADGRSKEEQTSTLVYGFDENMKTFDPVRQIYAQESAIIRQVLQPLVKWGDDLKIAPVLATSWEPQDDCKKWVFHLRENVKFHDGTPLTAEAVKAAIERFIDPRTAAAKANFLGNIQSVEAPDDLTVVFNLKESDCIFIELLTSTFATIYSPASFSQYGEDIAMHPVGTGPFVFDSWDQNTMVLKMHRNPSYWGGNVIKFDNLEFQQVVEKTTRLTLLEQGRLDAAAVAEELVDVAEKNPDITVQSKPYLSVMYIGFNCQKPPFNDKRVRQACNYAVNREELVKYLFSGKGTPAYAPFPEFLPDYNHSLKKYTYDPEKAKALLAEAGYPNGFKVTMWTQEVGSYNKVATAAVEYLRKVGVDVNVQVFDNAVYWNKFDEFNTPTGERYPTKEGVFDLFVGRWVGGESAFQFLEPLFRSNSNSNNSFYSRPEIDQLVKDIRKNPTEQGRRELMATMQDIIVEDAPWIFTYYGHSNVGIGSRVKGFQSNAGGLLYFEGVTLDGAK